MKYFSAMASINSELLEKFMEFANQNPTDRWVITLNSGGGSFFPTESMAKIINDHEDCEIIVQGAYSAGFMLLMTVKCKMFLSKGCRGMWHYGKWSIDFNDKGKPYYHDDVAIFANLPIFKRLSDRIAKKVMTAAELKKFKKDYDVYFSPQRMKQIFPDAEIMK